MLVEIETVLMLVIAYVVGLLSVILFNRYRNNTTQTMVDHEQRFKEYESMLVDMKIRLDTMELRTSTRDISRPSQDSDATASHKVRTIRRDLEQEGKGLVDYVLKLLADGPKTSRQIESVIGRSREHTARLMKKLYELGYVTRDVSAKPYTYTITENGKSVLSQVASVNSGA